MLDTMTAPTPTALAAADERSYHVRTTILQRAALEAAVMQGPVRRKLGRKVALPEVYCLLLEGLLLNHPETVQRILDELPAAA